MAPDLPEDRRRRERVKVRAPACVEAINGLDESDHGDLFEVVDRFPSIGIATGEGPGELPVLEDQGLAAIFGGYAHGSGGVVSRSTGHPYPVTVGNNLTFSAGVSRDRRRHRSP